MIKTETTTVVEFGQVIRTFEELSNWSSDHLGIWNADKSKPVIFHAELLEYTCQHEQDWMCFYYPSNYEDVTVELESLLIDVEKDEYKGKVSYIIGLGAILRWLVLKGELPDTGEFLVKGW